jgi:hypothetical protein
MQRRNVLKAASATLGQLVLFAGLAGSTPSVIGASQGDISSQSAHQRIVFENDHVRVNELFASAGAESPMHVQHPGVLVSVSKARFQMTAPSGAVTLVDYHPGQVLWMGESEKRSWKLSAGDAHIFFVEVKSATGGIAPPAAELEPKHSTLIDPDQHHLVIDNEHVRVIDGMAAAGARSATHTHPPSVLISLAKSRFKVTINGKTRIFDFEPATVRWTNHFEHTWQILTGDARVIMIELKSAHNAPEFRRRM